MQLPSLSYACLLICTDSNPPDSIHRCLLSAASARIHRMKAFVSDWTFSMLIRAMCCELFAFAQFVEEGGWATLVRFLYDHARPNLSALLSDLYQV